MYSYKAQKSDFLGILASLLCAIHCTMSPFIFLVGASLSEDESSTFKLDYVFLIISLAAVWYSAKHTKKSNLKIGFWIAWLAFVIGLLLEEMSPMLKAVGICGSICLISLHIINIRHCKKCNEEC